MSLDSSTAGAESPAFRPEEWDMSQENYKNFLQENAEKYPIDTTVAMARGVVKKLLLSQQVARMPGLSEEQLKILEARSDAITGKYLDELAATMQERLKKEGDGIREKYLLLINDTEHGRDAMEATLEKLDGFTEKDKESLRKILEHFIVLDEGEKGKSYLTRWLNRDATNGYLVQEDYEVFQRIEKNILKNPKNPSKEEQFLSMLRGNLVALRQMDPNNLTFIKSTPGLNPGGRFILTLLFGGIALMSLLMERKSGRIPKKGLVALGLLYYIHRNPASKLSFLSTPTYERLTTKLRGSDKGKKVIEALGDHANKDLHRDFAKQHRKRGKASPEQYKNLESSTKAREDLIAELGLKGTPIEDMTTEEIIELSRELQKFPSDGEQLDIVGEFTKEGVTKENVQELKDQEAKVKASDPTSPSA